MITGRVKWFNVKRGYGFITDESGKDHFVHYSHIKSDKKFKAIYQGQKVQFEVITEDGKEMAGNVTIVAD